MTTHLYILTGASRGMGLAMAEQLLQPGNTLLCISRHANADLALAAQKAAVALSQWTHDLTDGEGASERLRDWLGLAPADFYDEKKVAIMPMGFCYPGRGKSGDLPPRPECAPAWHDKVLMLMPHSELTLLIGQYAQQRYLGKARRASLTETVQHWRDYGDAWLPLPHPSPRNTLWLRKNTWFETDVVPELRTRVATLFP